VDVIDRFEDVYLDIILDNKNAVVTVESLECGKSKVSVKLKNNDQFLATSECETRYSLDLIKTILKVTGPAGICSEIIRDEKKEYVEITLKYDLLGYVDSEFFKGKTLLDFGCGAGSSTMILARMFPETKIVGVELNEALLEVANARIDFYQYKNVSFISSPNADELPYDLGEFDYIVLSAVYEHLLPKERECLFPMIWSHLKPGGVLFLDQTPYRYFPVETHTSALPFINYLPDKLAHIYATRFSKRKLKSNTWEMLLRGGIRGSTVNEVLARLKNEDCAASLMKPTGFGLKNRIDLWYIKMDRSKYPRLKEIYNIFTRCLFMLTRIELVPHLSLAIKKGTSTGDAPIGDK
jgi:2-polyprenyl-3-methyl-5-hydroxy-6-metoxy-1,4-benzoquinol methylase